MKKKSLTNFPVFGKFFNPLNRNLIFNNLKRWDSSISFFIKFSILPSLIDKNKNRLKTIFCNIIKDTRVWNEISLMFDFKLLSFDYNYLYSNYFSGNFNSLSLMLFDIYLSEFDFYVFNLSRYFFYKYFFYKDLFYYTFHNKIPIKVLPLFLRKFNNLSKSDFFFSKNIFFFKKSLSYFRYVGYFFFGIVGSNFFAKKLEIKFISFVRGNLLIEIADISIFSSLDRNIIFGGFHICFFPTSFIDFNFISRKKVLIDSIFFKFNKFKLNLSKNFVNRFYFEILFRLEKFNFSYIEKRNLLNDKKIWFFFLFSESLNLFNIKNSFNYSIYSKLSSQKFYLVYYFNYYVFLFKKFLFSFDSNFLAISVLPLDLSFNFILNEFKTNLLIINNDLLDLFDFRVKFVRSYFMNERSFFSGILFSTQDILFLSYFYHLKPFFVCKNSVRLFIPLKIIFYRLRLIGIFHSFKNRPIGSSFFIFQEDEFIFQFFVSLYFSFFVWYDSRLVYNFFKMYFILRLFYRSFLLTISRKHNKPISWSYTLYRKIIFKKSETYFLNNCYTLNERFFLTF